MAALMSSSHLKQCRLEDILTAGERQSPVTSDFLTYNPGCKGPAWGIDKA